MAKQPKSSRKTKSWVFCVCLSIDDAHVVVDYSPLGDDAILLPSGPQHRPDERAGWSSERPGARMLQNMGHANICSCLWSSSVLFTAEERPRQRRKAGWQHAAHAHGEAIPRPTRSDNGRAASVMPWQKPHERRATSPCLRRRGLCGRLPG